MDYYQKMDLDVKKRNKQLYEQFKHRTPSQSRSYDPTMHLAQEMVTVSHGGNGVKCQLIKNIDNGSKHYGEKTLLGYKTDKHHHLLVMTLPLNDAQYRAIKDNANSWY